jgi:hypothetical protein
MEETLAVAMERDALDDALDPDFRWEKLKKVPHMAKGRVQRKLNF